MQKVGVKTIEHVLLILHEIFDNTDKYLKGDGVTEYNTDILEDAKDVLISLHERIIVQENVTDGAMHVEIQDYIETKLDTINSILAIDMLINEKSKEYQQLMARSSREYEKIKKNTENLAVRNSFKVKMQEEIDKTNQYLKHLLDISKVKKESLMKKLHEHQEKNRHLLNLLSNI